MSKTRTPATPPRPASELPADRSELDIPRHIAIVMDGNGRWANQRGLARTAGHRAGEDSLMDVLAGAIELGVQTVSVYAFSTENWRRSPHEVAFLMNYSRDVIKERRDELDSWGVRIVWSGRYKRLWRSVLNELQTAQRQTRNNRTLTLNFCMNYGGRAEITDAVAELSRDVLSGAIDPLQISEDLIEQYLYQPDLPDVDLFIRSGGERRISNFMLWETSYAELLFAPEPWPEFDRELLWRCVRDFTNRDRRFGGAVDKVTS